MFLRIPCSRNCNFRPAYIAVAIAACTAMLPAVSLAREIVPSIRPIVALNEPKAQLDSFLLLLDAPAEAGTEERNAFKHHFFEQRNAEARVPPPPPPAAGAAAPPAEPAAEAAPANAESPADQSTDQSNTAAKPDPNFDRWQKDANERLKEENAIKEPVQHPLAAANPGNNVVVCEAGCRTPKDEIVYIAAIVRNDVPDKKFEPSSANRDDGSVPCIAGCYDRDEPKRPASRSHAEIAHPVRVATAKSDDISSHIVKGHVATGPVHPEKVTRSDSSRPSVKRLRTQSAHNGAIVESRRLSRTAELLRRSHFKSSAAIRKKSPGSWHARVTRGEVQNQRRHSLLGSGQGARPVTDRAHGWKAFIHIGSR
jgi:hypothetical protein